MLETAVVLQLQQDVGEELARQLMLVFIEESKKTVGQLCTVAIHDPDVILFSHSLKSSAKTYGAMTLGLLCEDIERAAKGDNAVELERLLQRLPDIAEQTFIAAMAYTPL